MEETPNKELAPSPKSGNKTLIIIIVVVIILLAGWALMRGKSGQSLLGGNTAPTSLKALMALGVPQQCSFSVKDENANGAGETKGNVYISGNKMRVDTETHMMMDGKDTLLTNHMLSDGTHYYMWSDEDKTRGIKMAMTEEMMKAPEGQNQKPPVDPDMAMNYNCSPSLSDASKLEIPKDVTFMDMSEMMKGVPGAGTSAGMGDRMNEGTGANMKAMQCAACDQAGDQKAACLQALGC